MVVERAKPKKHANTTRTTNELSVWERLGKIGESIPADARARLPRDLSRNLDHYLDGSPKDD